MRPTRRHALTAAGLAVAGRLRGQDLPRTAGLTVRMHEPENLEGPFAELADSFLTPVEKFYVRSHFAVPKLDAGYLPADRGRAGGQPAQSLSLADLKGMAPVSRPAHAWSVPATAGCSWCRRCRGCSGARGRSARPTGTGCRSGRCWTGRR